MKNSMLQDMLGMSAEDAAVDTNVDIVFAIDGTGSMQPLIDKVKNLTLTFHKELENGLAEKRRKIHSLRIKVIVFRDYYIDGDYAMQQSKFFTLPEENKAFYDYVAGIRAGGGGDEPESGLEALAEALRSDFVQEGAKKRHVIVLFTDASAHPYEKQQNGVPKNYPKNMFRNLPELYRAWGHGQDFLGASTKSVQMNRDAKRLVLFAPSVYPWNELEADLENVIRKDLSSGDGGKDLDLTDVVALVANSIA